MAYDTSSRKDVRKAEKEADRRQRSDDLVLNTLLSTSSGREWVWNRLGAMFVTPYAVEPTATAFNCGLQSAAIDLFQAAVRVSPENVIQAMHEANIRTLTNERRNESSGTAPGSERSSGESAGRDSAEPNSIATDYDHLAGDDGETS